MSGHQRLCATDRYGRRAEGENSVNAATSQEGGSNEEVQTGYTASKKGRWVGVVGEERQGFKLSSVVSRLHVYHAYRDCTSVSHRLLGNAGQSQWQIVTVLCRGGK